MDADFPSEVWDAWMCWEAFRRLGFAPDALHVGLGAPAHTGPVLVRVEVNEPPGFTLDVAPWPLPVAAFEPLWREFARQLNAGELATARLEAEWSDRFPADWPAALLNALTSKGVLPPSYTGRAAPRGAFE